MGHQSAFIGRDKHVPPKGRRGTLVVPAEKEWIIDSVFIGPDKRVPPRCGHMR